MARMKSYKVGETYECTAGCVTCPYGRMVTLKENGSYWRCPHCGARILCPSGVAWKTITNAAGERETIAICNRCQSELEPLLGPRSRHLRSRVPSVPGKEGKGQKRRIVVPRVKPSAVAQHSGSRGSTTTGSKSTVSSSVPSSISQGSANSQAGSVHSKSVFPSQASQGASMGYSVSSVSPSSGASASQSSPGSLSGSLPLSGTQPTSGTIPGTRGSSSLSSPSVGSSLSTGSSVSISSVSSSRNAGLASSSPSSSHLSMSQSDFGGFVDKPGITVDSVIRGDRWFNKSSNSSDITLRDLIKSLDDVHANIESALASSKKEIEENWKKIKLQL